MSTSASLDVAATAAVVMAPFGMEVSSASVPGDTLCCSSPAPSCPARPSAVACSGSACAPLPAQVSTFPSRCGMPQPNACAVTCYQVHKAAAARPIHQLCCACVRAGAANNSFGGLGCFTLNTVQRECASSGFYAHRCTVLAMCRPMCGTDALARQTRQLRAASCRPACAVEARLCCANRTLLHTSNRKLITHSPTSNTAMLSQDSASITSWTPRARRWTMHGVQSRT